MPLRHNHRYMSLHSHTSKRLCEEVSAKKLVLGRRAFHYQADGGGWDRLTRLISGGRLINGVNNGLKHLQIATRHLPSLFLLACSFFLISVFTDGKVTNKEQINPTAECRSIFHFQMSQSIYTLLKKNESVKVVLA